MTNSEHVAVLADDQTKGSHAPGPWEILADPDDRSGWVVVDATHTRFQIASVEPRFRPKEELANARLIAAAPALLDALKDLVQWQDEMKNAVPRIYLDRAKRAMAKAEGRS